LARRQATLRAALWTGMGGLGLLLALGGGVNWLSVRRQSAAVEETLGRLQRQVNLTLRLSTGVAQELLLAERYLGGDRSSRASFEQLGFDLRRTYRELDRLAGRTAEDANLAAGIMRNVAGAEAHYAMAHRLLDLGRAAEARSRAAQAAPLTAAALAALATMGEVQERAISAATADLSRRAQRRMVLQLALLAGALLLALYIAWRTVHSVVRPLGAVVEHARRLSEGDLAARTRVEGLPREFAVLVESVNRAAGSLSGFASIVADTAGEVAESANTVAAGAEQITASAGEVVRSISHVSQGAENQVAHLRTVGESLGEIAGSATQVGSSAGDVKNLADEIRRSAEEKRLEVGRAVEALRAVRDSVHAAASDVSSLQEATAQIRRFVDLVGAISRQTNLLGVNAAIEAARVGEHGKGFRIVAGEMRQLTERTQAAAREVVQTTELVTGRMETATRSISAGVAQVGEIERLSQALDEALAGIAAAAARTGAAADQLLAAAQQNAAAAASATTELSGISQAAEGNAAAAQQVTAASEEQSAACQEVSATAAALLTGSGRLQEAVLRFHTAEGETQDLPPTGAPG